MTWAAFEQYALDTYKSYIYLAFEHGLDTPVLEALGRTRMFIPENHMRDEFILQVKGVVRPTHPYPEDTPNVFSADYTDLDSILRSVVMFYDPLRIMITYINLESVIYGWEDGYHITRNGLPITRDALLETIAQDLRG